MPRIAIDEFGDGEAVEVYIAGRLAEAQLIEELFNRRDLDYAVEVEWEVLSLASPNMPALHFTYPWNERNFAVEFCEKRDSRRA